MAVGTDLFKIDGTHYVLTVDYFSRYAGVIQLTSTTSAAVIRALKSVFSRHRIPETVRSDNGPQDMVDIIPQLLIPSTLIRY